MTPFLEHLDQQLEHAEDWIIRYYSTRGQNIIETVLAVIVLGLFGGVWGVVIWWSLS